MHRLRHPIATFIITVLVVIAIGVGVVAETGNASLVSSSVWPSVLATIAGEQAFAFSVAPPATVARVSLSEAIRTGAMHPATVVAAQLLEIREPVTKDRTTLVWAIQESLTMSGPQNGPPGIGESRVRYDFQVDFVNADSGTVVFSTEGYAPKGTPLG
jgi:hypothetical protein